ncbi:type ISP restriction/modification enzyme [Bosea psychrotolerans]|uniref:site-specific DNA-methyltransferase (adenine-specific) n=1 Tax=Bosea psychrotolerans TaxID=1871628 RepID=A0A2S4LX60_9HYPH|nr:type ISP restriction/modification enzyme [Bosea psychrotolerans]POR46965.1 N-6 DNA methylase [Bosea psychrotolerans]
MSQILIQAYLNDLDRVRKFSGSVTENNIREAFKDLLKAWSKQNHLHFVAELAFESPQKNRIVPDGAILHDLRVPLGYWEAKDTGDDLDEEIRKKLAKGYPQDNIIFENSDTAVLIQNRQEVLRCSMTDVAQLGKLVSLFFSYERQEIREFRKAVAQFRADLPAVLEALRAKIDAAYASNAAFLEAANTFLAQAKQTINPVVSEADVREMLIQHILTEEIFANVFNDSDFHRENNIAKALYGLEAKFFFGATKRDTLKALEPYYAAIRANAAQITSHAQKQTFLKVIYENFYKVYNPKAADRLGVVYTPNEIVRFMIEGADWLCQKHFGKALIDRDVEILDPATGTGTFICELLEHFRGQPQKLTHKYKEELHANEVAILPYYVANLNIEATYAAITGQFAEFPSLCFVDTLDNVEGLGIRSGHQHDLFGAMSAENVERIKRQNRRKISVIIGNPPYNASQQSENDDNKNRTYLRIDQRIRSTYVKKSAAQKTALYDMYARFYRWASDRLHDDGVLAFVTNRSFIESRTYDGFRSVVANEFSEIFVIDLGGDVRSNPKLSGTKHNVFGIQTGIAIAFLVKNRKHKGCRIHYARRPELETSEDKLAWLGSQKAVALTYDQITPDSKHNWLNLTHNDWPDLVPIADKRTKNSISKSQKRAIFDEYSTGIMTGRDEWVYDFNAQKLEFKLDKFNLSIVNIKNGDKYDNSIVKLSRNIKRKIDSNNINLRNSVEIGDFRPFVKKQIAFSRFIVDEVGSFAGFIGHENKTISFLCVSSSNKLSTLAATGIVDYGFLKNGNGGTQCLFRYRYTSDGQRSDNITDWGLSQFQNNFGKKPDDRMLTKDDIFHYVYGVLHDPIYRETYAQNLKREFPRIPFYPDFWRWAGWGKTLMTLHIGYESVEPWPLLRLDTPDEKARAAGVTPKPILKPDRDNGIIVLDSETQLSGVPPEAWSYKLGNRSGLDWVLDQHKEKTPKDPTIREKFNTYRFADYKEKVVDLLGRVTRVSVETVAITEAMKAIRR